MDVQSLVEDYLTLLKRENKYLTEKIIELRESQEMLDRSIIMRNTLLWRLAIWDPKAENSESDIHRTFQLAIKAGANYDNVDAVVEAIYQECCMKPAQEKAQPKDAL